MKLWCFPLVVLLLFAVPEVRSQQILIRIDEPFRSSSLAGRITDRNGEPIPGVEVVRFSGDWKRRLTSTETNSNGYFKFRGFREGTYFLKFSRMGFQDYEVKVVVSRRNKKIPTFTMEVAT